MSKYTCIIIYIHACTVNSGAQVPVLLFGDCAFARYGLRGPRVATSEASCKTKRHRSHQLAGVREAVSGGVGEAEMKLEDELSRGGMRKLLHDSRVFSKPHS